MAFKASLGPGKEENIKDAKIEYLKMNCNSTFDSNLIELARFGAYYFVFTFFFQRSLKKIDNIK